MDRLYQLAFAFKKTKLWRKLSDSQIFAVALSDGEIGYCCVMGMLGEHLALALYPGLPGLCSYTTLLGIEAYEINENSPYYAESALSQDCLMCSFENKDMLRDSEIAAVRKYCAANGITLRGPHSWPQLLRYRPFHVPWMIQQKEDEARIAEGLEAAIEVAGRLEKTPAASLGLTQGPPFKRDIPLLVKTESGYDWQTTTLPPLMEPSYPAGGPLYDLSLKRASMKKNRSGTWACSVFLMPKPIFAEDDGPEEMPENEMDLPAPHFPWVQMVVNVDSQLILDTSVCMEPDDYAEQFPNKLLDLIGTVGKPRRLLVETERAAALYRDLAKRVGFPLELVESCSNMDEALEDFMAHIDSGFDDENMDMPEDLMEMLTSLFYNGGDFSSLPNEMLLAMNNIAELMGPDLPEEFRKQLDSEIRRRFS